MSKMIKMTREYLEECRKDFEDTIAKAKLSDGKINFTKTFAYSDKKATVYFSAEAWTKMLLLLDNFDKEVAWHGLARRMADGTSNEYTIYDILVYPQEVTGATVNTDQETYEQWLIERPDESFNNIRMQGHSHVNMGTSPSSTDLVHQERILEQLEDDMFYIFMIWNKSLKREIKIYDLQKNILFEDGDISVKLSDDGFALSEFLQDAKTSVKEKTYNYGNGLAGSLYSTTVSTNSDIKPYNPFPGNTVNQNTSVNHNKKDSDKKNKKKKNKSSFSSYLNTTTTKQSPSLSGDYDYDLEALYGSFEYYGR